MPKPKSKAKISKPKSKQKTSIKKSKVKTDGGYRPPSREELVKLTSGSELKDGGTGPAQFARAYEIVMHALGNSRELGELRRGIGPDERYTLRNMAEQYARENQKPLPKDAKARLAKDI